MGPLGAGRRGGRFFPLHLPAQPSDPWMAGRRSGCRRTIAGGAPVCDHRRRRGQPVDRCGSGRDPHQQAHRARAFPGIAGGRARLRGPRSGRHQRHGGAPHVRRLARDLRQRPEGGLDGSPDRQPDRRGRRAPAPGDRHRVHRRQLHGGAGSAGAPRGRDARHRAQSRRWSGSSAPEPPRSPTPTSSIWKVAPTSRITPTAKASSRP